VASPNGADGNGGSKEVAQNPLQVDSRLRCSPPLHLDRFSRQPGNAGFRRRAPPFRRCHASAVRFTLVRGAGVGWVLQPAGRFAMSATLVLGPASGTINDPNPRAHHASKNIGQGLARRAALALSRRDARC